MKYRVYPTKSQRTKMQHLLDTSRWVYNKTLESWQKTYKESGEILGYVPSTKLLTQWRKENEWIRSGHSQVQQEAQRRVDLAFSHFFRRMRNNQTPGYPRFKGNWYKSFTFPQQKGNFRLTDEGRLRVSKVGHIKIKLHRPLGGKPKRLTLKRDLLGNWWAYILCEVEPKPLPPTRKIVGIDLGLKELATLTSPIEWLNDKECDVIPNPRFLRKSEKALIRKQRKLETCKKGSPERYKQKRALQHIHQRIVNHRTNFAHQLSRTLVNEFQVIVFEDLNILNMVSGRWHGKNKSIADAGWGYLMQYTMYKAESANRSVILVNPHNTSQMCSSCGKIVKKDLSVRIHSCPYCGLEIDRDRNAALNVLALGLQSLGLIPKSPQGSKQGSSHSGCQVLFP